MIKKQAGFTLAELLIAMVILGIIASFFIPQVLNAVGQQGNISKVKDAVALIESSLYNCTLDSSCGALVAADDLYEIFVDPATRPGVAKWKTIATSAAALADDTDLGLTQDTHPCDAGAALTNASGSTGWAILTSGQLITGLKGATPTPMRAATVAGRTYSFCIDANGAAGPNTAGQDVRYGNFALQRATVNNTLAASLAGGPTAADFSWGNPAGANTSVTQGESATVIACAAGTNCDAATALGR